MQDEFDQIKDTSMLYAYLEKVINEKLWLNAGLRSPNWPIGATRIIQYRVKTPKKCAKKNVPHSGSNAVAQPSNGAQSQSVSG